jgi:hypothetical protein
MKDKRKKRPMAGVIEVDLFPKELDSQDAPAVVKFKKLLQDVAEDFHCRLLSFEVREGTVSFSFDNDELTAEILKILQEKE